MVIFQNFGRVYVKYELKTLAEGYILACLIRYCPFYWSIESSQPRVILMLMTKLIYKHFV